MDHRVQAIIVYMQGNLHKKLLVSKLAKRVNISPSHLGYLFKAETDISLMQHLHRLRMEEARWLVETTHLSLKEIMRKVGINDESHFVRDFKHEYGLPPVQYRARFHSGSIGEED